MREVDQELFDAVEQGNLSRVKRCIDRGANIYAKNTFGSKALHIAALNGHKNVVEFFLDRGLSVNEPSKDNCTPLHCAARAGKLEFVGFLIKEGADIYVKDDNGDTPLDYAKKAGRMEIVNILGSAENKSQLSKTARRTDGRPESDLSSVTISNQPMRARAPGN